MRFFCILLTSLFFFFAGLNAQTRIVRGPQKSLVGIEVHFRLDKHNLDLNYMGNDEALRLFANTIDSIGLSRIDSVVIVSQSSPEGVYEHNIKLSERRARTMRRYIEGNHPLLKDKLFVHPDGESWQQLRDYVESDTKLKDATKAKILSIIDADINIGTKKWRMQQLPVYRYLLATYYKRIRNSMFCILYFSEDRLMDILPEPEPKVWPKAEFIPVTSYKQEHRNIYFALKTNLLYDALLVPNIGAELYLGKNYSLAANWHYARWNSDSWYWRTYGGEVALRKWFGKESKNNPLTGHHLGLYGGLLTYDFLVNGKGYMSGNPGEALNGNPSYMFGLEYGFSCPIARCLNLDFVVGFGYQGGIFKEYKLLDDHYVWEASKKRHFIGPTKAEISLVWHLWKMKKGGAL